MYIAYYRVSRKSQGVSGLGLGAQKKAVEDYIHADARRELLAEYTEVESGKKDKRPRLEEAIEYAKQAKATLLVAKLDRLSRNVSFLFTLRDSKVDFKSLDLPDANTLTIGIFASMAQHEREIISQRTRSALAVLKAKGVALGTPENLSHKAQKLGGKVARENAKNDKNNLQALELINDKLKAGWTYQQIADRLNKLEYKTSRGKIFRAITVRKLLERSEKWTK